MQFWYFIASLNCLNRSFELLSGTDVVVRLHNLDWSDSFFQKNFLNSLFSRIEIFAFENFFDLFFPPFELLSFFVHPVVAVFKVVIVLVPVFCNTSGIQFEMFWFKDYEKGYFKFVGLLYYILLCFFLIIPKTCFKSMLVNNLSK